LPIGLLAAVPSSLPGQQPTNPAPTVQAPDPRSSSSADTHTDARSREMFTACDGDSDDRLDLFEASEALETLGDPKDGTGFRRLDRDRDGFLTWPEFDQHFRSVVQRGATFRVRTCRRLVTQAPEQLQPQAATPLQRFLKLYDQNGNGGLDPAEVDLLVQKAGLLPVVGTQLKALDLDKSGRVEETELAPFFESVRGSLSLPGLEPDRPTSPLPPAWAATDANGDGLVDLAELRRALQRIDPGLARWAERLLQRLDRDRSGKLGPDELPDAATGRAATTN
jgi:Ca2+-binding EF-hand superfamily protein